MRISKHSGFCLLAFKQYRSILVLIVTLILLQLVLREYKSSKAQENNQPALKFAPTQVSHSSNECVLPVTAPATNYNSAPTDPAFIIIGCQKCGTSALARLLAESPVLSQDLGEALELAFFVSSRDGKWKDGGCEDLRRYRAFFRIPPGSIGYEKTPAYICDRTVPERIQQWYPWMKFVLLVRDPVLRALSQFLMRRRVEARHLTFGEHIYDKDGNVEIRQMHCRRGFRSNMRDLVGRGLYAEHLNFWLQYFNQTQFLILPSENWKTRPEIELKRLETFLNIPLQLDDAIEKTAKKHIGQRTSSTAVDASMVPILADLRRFYAPHNRRFCDLVDGEALGITWCSYDDVQ